MRDHLLLLADSDRRLRSQLALSGELYAGYHPAMRALHETNARELELLVDDEGWPNLAEAGEDGCKAAFLIAIHAISRPSFQRRCLAQMKSGANRGEIPLWHPAMLEDRIRSLEGRPQIYGTQLDWDENGVLAPLPVDNDIELDQRRAKVGLPPLAEALAEAQARAQAEGECSPDAWLRRRDAMTEFAREVGWR